MGELEGCAAIVTGGASGIGAATAARFTREGATVAVFDRAGGPDAYEVDVRDGDAVSSAVEDFVGRTGRLDIVVNNAGDR